MPNREEKRGGQWCQDFRSTSSITSQPISAPSMQVHQTSYNSVPLATGIANLNYHHQWTRQLSPGHSGGSDFHQSSLVMIGQQQQWSACNQEQLLAGYYQYFLSVALNQQTSAHKAHPHPSVIANISNSPLWEQLKLPTNWMSDTAFENHCRTLQAMFVALMESYKAHLPQETLIFYDAHFRTLLQQLLLDRYKKPTRGGRDQQFNTQFEQSPDEQDKGIYYQPPHTLETSKGSDVPELPGNSSETGGPIITESVSQSNTPTVPELLPPDSYNAHYKSDSLNFTAGSSYGASRSRLGSWKRSWLATNSPRSTQWDRNSPRSSSTRQKQAEKTGTFLQSWTAPTVSSLIGAGSGFLPTGQPILNDLGAASSNATSLHAKTLLNNPCIQPYLMPNQQPSHVALSSFPRGANSLRLLGPGPMATEAPPVYVDPFNLLSSTNSIPTYTPHQFQSVGAGPNWIGQSILLQLMASETAALSGAPAFQDTLGSPSLAPSPLQSSCSSISPSALSEGCILAHQYILNKLRCTCKE